MNNEPIKHTTGPWTSKVGYAPGFYYVAASAADVALVPGTPGRSGQADANLIAAAPDLYRAIVTLLESSDYLPGRELLVRAVAKAEGRA